MSLGQAVSKPSRPYFFLPDGWDTHWKSAKFGASPSVMVLGDSIATGYNLASATLSNSFTGQVKAGLLSALGLSMGAEYFACTLSADGAVGSLPGAPWSAIENGSAVLTTTTGWHRTLRSSSTGVWELLFTSPYACTAMDLNYYDYTTGGSFGYRVDGGSTQTVTLAADNAIHQIQKTGLSNATHTLEMGQKTAQNCHCVGVSVYPGGRSGTGLQFARFASSGLGLVELSGAGQVSSSASPADRYGLYTGKTPQSDVGTIGTPFGFPLNPDLFILQLMVNDANHGEIASGASSWQQYASQIVRAVRMATADCSVLFIVPCYPAAAPYSDNATGLSNTASYNQYVQAAYAVANEHNCAALNVHAKWGSNPYGKGFMPNNNIHPLLAGHTDIATQILAIL